jgi:hypothetical protein
MDKELQEFIEDLGWKKEKEHDMIGNALFRYEVIDGFNTGRCYTLSISPRLKAGEPFMVAIKTENFGSYDISKQMTQYTLRNLLDLELLMLFKNIKHG